MRIRPLALLSVAALSGLLLAGCTSAPSGSQESPSATAAADLCSAKVPAGDASDSVKVDGDVGTDSEATFTTPLEITDIESTVIDEGSGDPLEAGDFVNLALSAFDAETGDKLGAQGYNNDLLPQQVAPEGFGQFIGCAKPGSRFVVTFPGNEEQGTPSEVLILDVLGTTPTAAWGEEQPPVDGFPTVTLDSDGSPEVELPEGDIPTQFEKATLKKGDGAVVQPGDEVLVQYHGVSWNTGDVFDESWGKQPFTFTVGSGVVQGFSDAVTGETVGSQVIAVLPPSVAYGEGEINESDLKGQTLVFVVDILAASTPPAQ